MAEDLATTSGVRPEKKLRCRPWTGMESVCVFLCFLLKRRWFGAYSSEFAAPFTGVLEWMVSGGRRLQEVPEVDVQIVVVVIGVVHFVEHLVVRQ